MSVVRRLLPRQELLSADSPPTDKALQILDGAARVFMARGYGRTSVNAVAEAAGVSKATLYGYFPGKEELFAAVIRRRCRDYTAQVIDLSTDDDAPVEEVLLTVGLAFARLVHAPEALAIFRIVVAETPNFPEFGRLFFESAPSVVLERISAYLRVATERGRLNVPEPRLAAFQFLEMARADIWLRRVLGLTTHVTDGEIEHVVRGVVGVFLRAYGLAREGGGSAPTPPPGVSDPWTP